MRFAWISDTHLYAQAATTRFVDTSLRAVRDVARQAGGFDFLIFGGDLAQLGRREELDLGHEILSELTIPKRFVPGEHDSSGRRSTSGRRAGWRPKSGWPRRPMRFEPGDPFDGVGWARLAVAAGRVDHEYLMWRTHVYRAADDQEGAPGPRAASGTAVGER